MRVLTMWHSPPEKQLRAHYASRTRTLEEAARAAHAIATAEHLPINAAPTGDPELWHRETLLKVVPVYGRRMRHSERVPVSAHLEGEHAAAEMGKWSDLTVKGADFQRYLDWLHSIW